jgi:uncharacterized protein (DUF433 family)
VTPLHICAILERDQPEGVAEADVQERHAITAPIRYSVGVRERIAIDPNVCHGKPCITGTRIMVANILSLLAGGYDSGRIRENYPELTDEDIRAAIEKVLR